MKLTKQIKAAILANVVADFATVNYHEQAERELRKVIDKLEPAWLATAKTAAAKNNIGGDAFLYYQRTWRLGVGVGYYGMEPPAHLVDAALAKTNFLALVEASKAQKSAHDTAEASLRSAMEPITTRKQFVEMFPELEKYAPEEYVPGKLLPQVTGVVTSLAAAGLKAAGATKCS